ncbi:phosphoglycolate phosphatase [Propionicicella superfundia]|uniref:phosphoglycolate phosphatase n=1 Tax=Propionicicella superfundia TaxID=348582 RepID=UPI00146B6F13|nr:phosphoglycolate phosphatase [Propionicicella superfundia]
MITVTELPAFHCFVLDMDGTVVDTAPDIARSANRTLAELGLPQLPYETVASYIGGGVPKLMERCLAERADQYMKQAVPLFMSLYDAEPAALSTLYPGVLDTIRTISDRGGLIGICTQKPEALAHKILDALGVGSYVKHLVGPESVTHRKPHPEPVVKVLTGLGSTAADAIFVGDTASDLQAASAAGVVACAVTYGYGSEQSLRAESPTYVIDDFEDLLTSVAVR